MLWENGTRKISNPHYANTIIIQYKYDSHSVVLADLLYKTKPHYSEDGTMRILTMRGPPVCTGTYERVEFSMNITHLPLSR